jgi:hypothetical protein
MFAEMCVRDIVDISDSPKKEADVQALNSQS